MSSEGRGQRLCRETYLTCAIAVEPEQVLWYFTVWRMKFNAAARGRPGRKSVLTRSTQILAQRR